MSTETGLLDSSVYVLVYTDVNKDWTVGQQCVCPTERLDCMTAVCLSWYIPMLTETGL